MENSEASVLLSSSKFQSKAEEVIKEGLSKPPLLTVLDKEFGEDQSSEHVQLENTSEIAGGMMLYTSGTTSRPVSRACHGESSRVTQ